MKITNKILIGLCTAGIFASASFAQEKEEKKNWSLAVNLGANISSGNTESYQVNAGAEYNYKIQDGNIKAGFTLNYGEAEKIDADGRKNMVRDVDKYNIYSSYKYNFSERYFADVKASMMHDYKADIKQRYTIGPNVGVNILNSETFVLNTSVGAVYLHENFEKDLGHDEYLAWRLAEDFTWNIVNGTKLVQGIEYVPESDDFDNFLLNFIVSLEAPVAKGISMFVTFKDTYDNQPVDKNKNNDASLMFGLQYSL